MSTSLRRIGQAQNALAAVRDDPAAGGLAGRIDSIIETLQRAESSDMASGPEQGDTGIRNTVVQELLDVMREQRRENIALQEEEDDIDFMGNLRQRGHEAVSKLIGFTAEFASELPHNLMSEEARKLFESSDTMRGPRYQHWDWLCSDKLEAHVREVVEFIRARYVRLRDVTAEDIIRWRTPDEKSILTAFCRCVATRWRTSTVASGQAYKTTKQIDTIRSALLENISYFAGVAQVDGRLVCHVPMMTPSMVRSMTSNVIDA